MLKKFFEKVKREEKPDLTGLAKIHRYDNEGFSCKPIVSSAYHHKLDFIHEVITDLDSTMGKVEGNRVISPENKEQKWSGCHCFFDTDTTHFLKNVLHFRASSKKNTAYIPTDTLIWVRNASPYTDDSGRVQPFIKWKVERYVSNGQKYEKTMNAVEYQWIQMPFSLAIDRLNLVRKLSIDGQVGEIYCEFYLLESQLSLLVFP